MIDIDTSLVLAELLAADHAPTPNLWKQPLISSRILEYELWNRPHARGLGPSHGERERAL